MLAEPMTLKEAKQFLAGRVRRQAELNCEPLSITAQEMLLFPEESASPKMVELSERFEAECDSHDYEIKIAALLLQAWEEDRHDRDKRQQWDDTLRACKEHDFYMLAMVRNAGIRRAGDNWRLLGAALLVIAVGGPIVFLIESYKEDFELFTAKYLHLNAIGTLWSSLAIAGIADGTGYEISRRIRRNRNSTEN